MDDCDTYIEKVGDIVICDVCLVTENDGLNKEWASGVETSLILCSSNIAERKEKEANGVLKVLTLETANAVLSRRQTSG